MVWVSYVFSVTMSLSFLLVTDDNILMPTHQVFSTSFSIVMESRPVNIQSWLNRDFLFLNKRDKYKKFTAHFGSNKAISLTANECLINDS